MVWILCCTGTPNAKVRTMVVPQEPQAPAQATPPAESEANCVRHRPVPLSRASGSSASSISTLSTARTAAAS